MTTLNYLTFPDVFQTGEAEKTLAHAQALLADPRIVPTTHLAYTVERYYVVDGLPVADEATGIDCTTYVEMGDFSSDQAYPRPYTVDLGAASRWIPLDGTFDDGQSLVPYRGTDPIVLDADGTSPTMDDEYEYLLGTQFAVGPALHLDGGDYLMTDEVRWGASSVTLALVAVLRTPALDSYGLIETYPADSANPDRPFVGLRYNRAGAVQTHTQGLQTNRQTTSQSVRTGQPIVVALRIEGGRTLDVAVVDRSLTATSYSLSAAHPGDARVYFGRSPGVELGFADMTLLECGVWYDLDNAGLLALVNHLDRLYGVSR